VRRIATAGMKQSVMTDGQPFLKGENDEKID
jgi:hypothetical protein